MAVPDEMSCGELGDVTAELALGALTGRERARAVAHLERCGACQERIWPLTVAGEGLLGLLPGRDPPLGFDTRALARAGLPGADAGSWPEQQPVKRAEAGGTAARPGWVRRLLAAAACAVAAAGAGAAGWGLSQAVRPPAPLLRSAALLSPGGQQVGEAFTYAGTPWWLYVQVDDGPGGSPLICQITGADGRSATVGAFRLTDGRGAWGSPPGTGSSWLTGTRLVAADGTVVATANFADA